jgi:heat shock protein HslJ/uncharacterized lipoprotein NlpE involved in copper resistance
MKIVVAMLAVFLCVGCNPREAKNPELPPTEVIGDSVISDLDTVHTSRNSLNYIGEYQGTLPCADCAGVKTSIELAEDFSYVLTRTYLGKSDQKIETKGNFKWNVAGDGIILSGLDKEPNQFLVSDISLTQLDLQGRKIGGKLAGSYVLTKMTEAQAIKADGEVEKKLPQIITGINWKLSEINGKTVAQQNGKDYFITFNDDNNFGAFAGCNRITGKYEFKDSHARMFHIISTMMACPDMKLEDEFKKALESTDNFVVNEKVLQFRKGAVNILKFDAGQALKKQ